jgi:hypothetical protein
MHKVIAENKTAKLIKLISLYKKNPLFARVSYFTSYQKGSSDYIQRRVVLYENDENFEFVMYQKTFGISTTSRMFNHESIKCKLTYSKGKFYHIVGKSITQMTFNDLDMFVSTFNNLAFDTHVSFTVKEYFINKFTWMRYISETSILQKKAFNTFIRYKLYSLNNAMRHFLKVPLPVVKEIRKAFNGLQLSNTESSSNGSHLNHIYQIWDEMHKVLVNVENLKAEVICNPYFVDICKMARTLGKKVNSSWSAKRIKQEHDNWAKEITYILMESQEVIVLNHNKLYLDFAEFSGYRILKTNRELMIEGMTQHHCVGTYVGSVERGTCAIFHIKGYTLEVKKRKIEEEKIHWGFTNRKEYNVTKGPLFIGQFHGFGNQEAPKELILEVASAISAFNDKFMQSDVPPREEKEEVVDLDDGIEGYENPIINQYPDF